jgi:excisionase family DNA binding protein
MTAPKTVSMPDLADILEDIERFKSDVIAEITDLRFLLSCNGIKPPPSRIDDGCLTVRQYAERHCISKEAVLGRIRNRKLDAEKVGKHWRIKKTD